jgi:uncharacterized membrane protein YecN with MAPEG domain
MPVLAFPVVSALTAGVAIIVQMLLLLLAARQRRRARQSLGEGADERLLRALRRHGNYAENAAIFLVCLALAEVMGTGRALIGAVALAFLLGRLLHAIGLSMPKTVNRWRISGVTLTVAAGVVLGIQLILLAAARFRA